MDALTSLLDPSITHFNKRCTSVTSTSTGRTSTIHFADGTTYEADVVIGADGIRSVTRNFVIGKDDAKPLVFANTYAYRGLVPFEDLVRDGIKTDLSARLTCYLGKGKVSHLNPLPQPVGDLGLN